MRFYNTNTQELVSIEQLRADNPFSAIPDNARNPVDGVFRLEESAEPAPLVNHKVEETIEEVEGKWTVVYVQVPLTPQEITAAKKARVPQSITMRQARLALLYSGMLDTVNTLIAGMTGDAGKAARIEWDYSSEVWRNKALVASLGPSLGLTEDQLDDLFIFAKTIL